MQIAPASLLLKISQDYAGYREQRESSWYGYLDGKKWGALPFAASFLYRGQNSWHFPMLPSISRGLKSSSSGELWKLSAVDQARIVIRLAQSWWFSYELKHHPITAHAVKQGLDLDAIAVAQHYGIPTGYLDLTDDFNVSAFFATCRETEAGWEPVSDGVGVIYRINHREMNDPFGKYIPLGPQLLPRPSEQCAWVTELPLCHSFDGWKNVYMMQFDHDRQVGEHFLEMFSGGKALFPSDPLATVAEEILSCRELPTDLVERALASFSIDPNGVRAKDLYGIRKEIKKQVTLTGDQRRLLTDTHVANLLDDSKWRERMLSGVKVKWRLDREIPIVNDGSDL